MTYTVDDAQHLFTLLGQAVWYTQHLELVVTQYNALMSLKLQQESGETIKEENVRNALNADKPLQLDKFVAEARKRGILSMKLEESLRMVLKTR